MSIQRWLLNLPHMIRHPDGNYVLYSDHVAAVEAAERAIFALHAEWTVTGMCEPGCLACRRLDELYAERRAGYEEGQNETQEHIGNPVSYAVGREQAIRDCITVVDRSSWDPRHTQVSLLVLNDALAALRALLKDGAE